MGASSRRGAHAHARGDELLLVRRQRDAPRRAKGFGMAVTVRIPTTLRPLAGGRSTVVSPRRSLRRDRALWPVPSTSRKPSPSVVNAKTVSAIAMPGTRSCQGWL